MGKSVPLYPKIEEIGIMTGQKAPTALGTEQIGKLLMQYAVPAIMLMAAGMIGTFPVLMQGLMLLLAVEIVLCLIFPKTLS